jgi:hypothetical protein
MLIAATDAAGAAPPAMVSAIYEGLNGGVNLSGVVPHCVTGNCTWDLYDSLALCANPVANLSHLLTRTAISFGADCSHFGTMSDHICNYSLPNGVYLSGQDMYMNITSIKFNWEGDPEPPSIAFPDMPVVLDFFMIYLSPSIGNVVAIEGSLSFCGQTYNTSVHNGQTNTTEIQRWGQLNTSHAFDFPPMWPLVGNSRTLWVAQGYFEALQSILQSTFSGYHLIADDGNDIYSSVVAEAMVTHLNNSRDDIVVLSLFMDEIAASITNKYENSIQSTLEKF